MRYWTLIEPYWGRVNIYDGPKAFKRSFSRLPSEVQTLVAAHWCESEVSNGGLEQFFSNPTGVLAPEAEAAYADLGLKDLAGVVRKAMALLGTPYPRHLARRSSCLARLTSAGEQPFEALDQAFYKKSGVSSPDPTSARLWVAMDRYAQKRSAPRAGRRTMR